MQFGQMLREQNGHLAPHRLWQWAQPPLSPPSCSVAGSEPCRCCDRNRDGPGLVVAQPWAWSVFEVRVSLPGPPPKHTWVFTPLQHQGEGRGGPLCVPPVSPPPGLPHVLGSREMPAERAVPEPRGAGGLLLAPDTPGRPPSPPSWRPRTRTVLAVRCHHAPPRPHLGAPRATVGPSASGTHRCPCWGGRTRSFPRRFRPCCPPCAGFDLPLPPSSPPPCDRGNGGAAGALSPFQGGVLSILPSRLPLDQRE